MTWFQMIFTCSLKVKGQCFSDASDTIKNMMEELKRLSQNGLLAEEYSCTRGPF
jgi:hypothetical protein